jgi:hypothetical protein
LFYSRGVKNIKEYAIGNRKFSTSAISATWIGGGILSQTITETYKKTVYILSFQH